MKDDVVRMLRELNQASASSDTPPLVSGEVIYESIPAGFNKKAMKLFVHECVSRRLAEFSESPVWASYLVIFSPGQDDEEIRCQVDIETDGRRAAFAIGYGLRPNHSFNDAVERLQWYEKNQPMQWIV